MGSTPLHPFVGPLADAARGPLVSLLGIDPARVTGFAIDGRSDPAAWVASITVDLGALPVVVDIAPARTARDAWFRTTHFAWAYRSTSGGDPFRAHADVARWLEDLRTRATRADGPLPTAEAREARDAVAHYLPFARLRDEDFRLLMDGPDGPRGALWLGFGCDQDCVVCWQRRDAPEPPAAHFTRWLDEMLAAGAREVILSGGEPTRRPALLLDLARRCRDAGAQVIVETNAMTLGDDPALRAALRDAGVAELSVSLHAADAATSDALTRTPGSHARTVAGIEACLRDGIPVGVHCVVERANAAALGDHARFVIARFAGPFRGLLRRVSYSLPTRYADLERYRRGLAPIDLVRPHLTAALRVLRADGIEARHLGTGGFPRCAVDDPRAERDVHVARDGARVLAAPCAGCAAREGCAGVPAEYVEACGDGGLRPLRASPEARPA